MSRAFILIMDSFGIGAAHDAAKYGDAGANTFGNIAEFCALDKADKVGLRSGSLQIPNLIRLGLHAATIASTGKPIIGFPRDTEIEAAFGYAVEQSLGKDTPSGHWEIAGVPVLFDWGYFPPEYPSFPAELIAAFIAQGEVPGILGNKHASGTEIINELGEEHLRSGKPIVYTSGDSVFQIAAHEDSFGLQRLYDLCTLTRRLVDPYNIARVIARPFLGTAGNFYRTGNRRDLAIPPPAPTLLEHVLAAEGGEVIAIGKIGDIFAYKGVSRVVKADSNMALFDATLKAAQEAKSGCLIFTNFVDFDMLYGHRRDVPGYAAALEAFDKRLPEFEQCLEPGDIAIIAADHGCDPTIPGSDHTREHIPVLMFGPEVTPGFIGRRDSFADIGQTIASHLNLEPLQHGISFLSH